jgi:hypothetical protein
VFAVTLFFSNYICPGHILQQFTEYHGDILCTKPLNISNVDTYLTAVTEYRGDTLLGTERLGQNVDEMRNNSYILLIKIITQL